MAEILVVGATGKTGGRVSAQLAAKGASVRAASRTLAPATANVTPIPFDWDDSGTYQPALDGVDGVYFVPPSLRTDYPPLVDAFLEAVTAAGVERIVYLSARGAVAGGCAGLLLAVILIVGSKNVWVQILGHSEALFPYEYPTLFSLGVALLISFLVSVTDGSARGVQDRRGFASQVIIAEGGPALADTATPEPGLRS